MVAFTHSIAYKISPYRQPEPEPDSEPHENPANNDGLPNHPPPPEVPNHAAAQAARVPLQEVILDASYPQRPPPCSLPREELEPPTRRRVPTSSSTAVSASTIVVSPYFSNATTSSTTLGQSSGLTSVRLSPVRRAPLPTEGAGEDSFDFSDDLPIDDTFLRELDAAEQAAMATGHPNSHNVGRSSVGLSNAGVETGAEHSEVIVIDSDSDDKENLAPVIQRRVRQRLESPAHDDTEVIVLE